MNLNSETILLTFGDSWTVGDGGGYTKGMTKIRYDELFKCNEDTVSYTHLRAHET